MAGVILETLSNKKLIAFSVVALVCQIACFLVGGKVAPSPYNVQSHLSTKCVSNVTENIPWQEPWGDLNPCNKVDSLHDEKSLEINKVDANHIVFAIRFPHRKNNEQLDMSRWHQNLLAVLQVDIHYGPDFEVSELSEMTFEARLGYKNKYDANSSDWTELASSSGTRQLKCAVSSSESETEAVHGNSVYKCDMLSLFEIGSCHHDYYLLNLRLPVNDDSSINAHIPMIEDVWIFLIHPNGGFTRVWFSLKTIMCPLVLVALCWHVYRIKQQDLPFTLLQKILVALGAALSLMNLPVEWFTLWIHMPYMLLFADIRQGIFYTVLLSFWVIFAGEHLMDQMERNRLLDYWKHLSAVAFGCICLFVFEMCERGVQLQNPFYSVWSTPTSSNIALGFIILAGVAACVYFLFLLYLIVKVFRNINAKKSSLPQMSKARRKFYMGLIYRFNFLMAMTLLCAACTVVFFILGQAMEGHWKWDEDRRIEYASAFMTGSYGMWNIYVVCLLVFYAPSTKNMNLGSDASEDEVIEFANIQTEQSVLTTLAQKEQLD